MPNLTPNLAWFGDQIPFVLLTIAAMFDSDVQFKFHSGRNAKRLNTRPNALAPNDSLVIDATIHN